jgi:hypothetical protein
MTTAEEKTYISQGKLQKAQEKLETLNDMNASILSLIEKAKDKIALIYQEGIKNQDTITLDNPKLNRIISGLKREDAKFNKILRSIESSSGENKSASLKHDSAYLHYILFFVITMVIILITAKVYATKQSGMIETVILGATAAIIVYRIITPFL